MCNGTNPSIREKKQHKKYKVQQYQYLCFQVIPIKHQKLRIQKITRGVRQGRQHSEDKLLQVIALASLGTSLKHIKHRPSSTAWRFSEIFDRGSKFLYVITICYSIKKYQQCNYIGHSLLMAWVTLSIYKRQSSILYFILVN